MTKNDAILSTRPVWQARCGQKSELQVSSGKREGLKRAGRQAGSCAEKVGSSGIRLQRLAQRKKNIQTGGDRN